MNSSGVGDAAATVPDWPGILTDSGLDPTTATRAVHTQLDLIT